MDPDFRDSFTVPNDVIEGGHALFSPCMGSRELFDEDLRISSGLSAVMKNGLRISHPAMGHHILGIRSQPISRILQAMVLFAG